MKTNQQRYTRERELEDAVLRMANTHAEGIQTTDLMDLVRDVADAADRCRMNGTTQSAVASIIEDTFGAFTDKEEARAEIEAKKTR